MGSQRVVVSGLGIVSPIGHSRDVILQHLQEQQHGFHFLPEYADFKTSKVSIGAKIPDFDTASHFPEDWKAPYAYSLRKDVLRGFNPHCFYAYFATLQALEEAGLSTDALGEETGLYTASAGSSSSFYRNLDTMFSSGVSRTSPLGIVRSVAGTLSFNLASVFEIQGASCGFASACASSAHALGFAFDEISSGKQDRIIVIGAEDGNLESVLAFASMHALSTSSDPNAASLPFDQRRRGFVGSGGAATLVLESLESANKRGAQPLGEILGWGQASDGYSPAIPHPEGRGLARAMQKALTHSGTPADAFAYINAHATGTSVGDLAEAEAIHTVMKSHQPLISSTKALTGHTLSMAGALELGLSLLALNEGFVPGTAHLTEPDKALPDLKLPRDNEAASVSHFLSNSSGFGGANVCLAAKTRAFI